MRPRRSWVSLAIAMVSLACAREPVNAPPRTEATPAGSDPKAQTADHDEAAGGTDVPDDTALRPPRSPPPDPPAPVDPFASSLPRVLTRAIEPIDGEEATWQVDPFVAAWIIDALEATEGRPYFEAVRPAKRGKRAKKTAKSGFAGTRGWRVRTLEGDAVFTRLGLREGDVITKIGPTPAAGPKRLRQALDAVDDELEITIERDDEALVLRYRLAGGLAWRDAIAERTGRQVVTPSAGAPEPTPAPSGGGGTGAGRTGGGKPTGGGVPQTTGTGPKTPGPAPKNPATDPIGPVPITCVGITCTVPKAYFDSMVGSPSKLRSHAKLKDHAQGYLLSWVRPAGAADKLMLRGGDIVTKVNGRRLNNDLEAMSVYLSLGSTRKYVLDFRRGGASQRRIILVK